ncbi:MAG: M23 family metallopeptidase [Hyphomonadaceae bacterium]|nr:M23 family metallopeptidase [Hyphomonadaceae bacterium]
MSLAACDAGNVLLWPWVESDKTANADAPPPPPPPLSPVDPLDPDATQTADAVPNPNANTGAPTDGTPFSDGKPENPSIDTGDASPPVSAETGEELPPLPVPTEEASTPTTPAEPPVTTPETPPTTTPTPAPTPVPASFYYFRPGNLAPSSGTGALEAAALVPDMAFPIKSAPAIAQTQVYRYGGGVKGGDQCDVRNFTAPWRDNYCEARTTTNKTPWCAKTGVHLGQDIRVGTPDGCKAERATKAADRARYEVVAVEDGVISNVGSYSITLRADSGGRIYRYLHLNMAKLKVATNQTVKKGDVIGYVSNDFGGTPTTLHLHFEIKLNTAENGWQYAPPYTSLLAAYQRREANEGERVADDFAVASAPR